MAKNNKTEKSSEESTANLIADMLDAGYKESERAKDILDKVDQMISLRSSCKAQLYDKESIFKKALQVIYAYNLRTMEEVKAHLPCSTYAFREMIPVNSPDDIILKQAIEEAKVRVKIELREKWRNEAANATTQIALYKLMATDEEREILSTSTVNNKLSGEIEAKVNIEVVSSDIPLASSESEVMFNEDE